MISLKSCDTFSASSPMGDVGVVGYVTNQLPNHPPNAGSDHVLLCGHPQMVYDCCSLLKGTGFGARQVTREKYVFAREAKALKKRAY